MSAPLLERADLARDIATRDRLLVVYFADWCPYSRRFLPLFDEAEPLASVPFARADISDEDDPWWDDHGIEVVPTLVYYEHGEPLERLDALRGHGIAPAELEEFLVHVEALQPEPKLPRRWRRRAR